MISCKSWILYMFYMRVSISFLWRWFDCWLIRCRYYCNFKNVHMWLIFISILICSLAVAMVLTKYTFWVGVYGRTCSAFLTGSCLIGGCDYHRHGQRRSVHGNNALVNSLSVWFKFDIVIRIFQLRISREFGWTIIWSFCNEKISRAVIDGYN